MIVALERADRCRQENRNAMSPALLAGLEGAVAAVERAENLKLLVLRGEGRVFSTGADLPAVEALPTREAADFFRRGRALLLRLERLMAFDADIRGTWGCLPEHYPAILDQVLEEKIRIRPFVATRPMDHIRETFEELRCRRAGMQRVVLTPVFA